MRLHWLFAASFAVALLAIGGVARADARVEARRHFKTGMALITEGRYDDGVAELLQAYSIRPHPNLLFNIARALESAGRVEDAVSYYRRYLETNPPDAAEVTLALRKLEARLPQEQEPPTAPTEHRADEPLGPAPSDERQATGASAGTPGAGGREGERPPTPRAEGEADWRRADPSQRPSADPDEGLAGSSAPYEETVVLASRRAQSTLEAPNAITVITGEEIRASGLTSLPEILRRVPGAEVMTSNYANADVSFRGFNQRISNKVLLLVDGRPDYLDFLGLTLWSSLAIQPEEIERIEVIRGPGSALYGANAMMGVINIVTRAPGSGPPAQLTALAGNGKLASGSAVFSGGQRLAYRLSAGYVQANKYSRDYADGRPDVAPAPLMSDPSLGLRGVRANATLLYTFDRDHSVALAGGFEDGFSEVLATAVLRNFAFDGTASYLKLDVNAAPLKLRLFWNMQSADGGPQYEPIGQRSMAMKVSSNILDGELFYQSDFELGGTHVLAAGASARLKDIQWTYLDSAKKEMHGAGFIQDEWRPLKPLSFVASYRVDGHPLLNRGKPGFAHSPRLSAVVSPGEGHALRASFATAFREPTFLESYLNLRTPIPGVNGGTLLTVGNTGLRPERLTSFEAGYRGETAHLGISWDLALYWNIVRDLTMLSAVLPVDILHARDPTTNSFLIGQSEWVNDPTIYTARGAELGLTWNVISGLDLRASASVQGVVSNSKKEVCGPCAQAPALKANGGAAYRSPVGLDLSADFSYVSSTTWVEREISRGDWTRITLLRNPLAAYFVVNARIAYRFLDDRVTVSVVGSQLGRDHQEHPFGNQINRRIFGALTVQP
jgi:iron complex outermembrane receptor protein